MLSMVTESLWNLTYLPMFFSKAPIRGKKLSLCNGRGAIKFCVWSSRVTPDPSLYLFYTRNMRAVCHRNATEGMLSRLQWILSRWQQIHKLIIEPPTTNCIFTSSITVDYLSIRLFIVFKSRVAAGNDMFNIAAILFEMKCVPACMSKNANTTRL